MMKPVMRTASRFNREQAEAKLGCRVRSRIGFSDIPLGTPGHVSSADEIEQDGFELVIEWDIPDHESSPKYDWFNKDEFETAFIEE
jgi:hypothetical protein